MAKLERCGNGLRQDREEILQEGSIQLQVRRQLKQDRAQLPRGSQRLNRGQKTRNEVFCPFQAFDVGDDLVRFDAEPEMRRGFLNPVLDRRFFYQLAEGEVDFNGVKLRSVVAEEFFLGKLRGVEIGFPRWVGPARSSGE